MAKAFTCVSYKDGQKFHDVGFADDLADAVVLAAAVYQARIDAQGAETDYAVAVHNTDGVIVAACGRLDEFPLPA